MKFKNVKINLLKYFMISHENFCFDTNDVSFQFNFFNLKGKIIES